MTELQVVFIIGAAITLLAAILVVTVKNLIHAAFYLILALFGIAVLILFIAVFRTSTISGWPFPCA